MTILNIQTAPPAGQAAVTSSTMSTQSTLPGLIYILTDDTYAEVTATGYLTNAKSLGNSFSNNQMALVYTTDEGPLWLKVVITYSGASVLNTVVSLVQISSPGDVVLPTIAGALAVFSDTAGTINESIASTNSVTTSSATPGTIRSIKGLMIGTNATMTTGNLVGVRGEVDCVGASGGFLYGVQGKIIPTGTLSGSSWTAGVFGQLDISAATINAGQTAAVWGDMGATSGTLTNVAGMRMFAGTNTTAAVLNAMDYRYGKATSLLELAGVAGTYITSGGAGTLSGTINKIAITIEGVVYYIPCATVIS